MIVDVHTHLGESPQHVGNRFATEARSTWGSDLPVGSTQDDHYAGTRKCDKVVAVAMNAPAYDWVVPNDYVAEYVKRDPGRLIGFGSVNPHDPDAPTEIERMKFSLGLRGCKMGPIYQNIDPLSIGFLRVCKSLEALEMPMLIHQGATFGHFGSLLHARPILLDEVARFCPNLKMVVAHVGHPWIEETIVVIRRHRNMFADISSLHRRPWQLYRTLVSAIEYKTHEKLLFGSDYPFMTPEETMAGLRAMVDFAKGTAFPTIPESVIEGIIHRPSAELLGLE